MDIDVLKSLTSVAETGSFSRSANLLCLSQSAISKRIKLLEESLNVQLLDRSGAQLALTPAGEIVEKNARAIINICARCTMELENLKGEKKVDFRCTPSFGLSGLPLVTKELMAQRPDIRNFSISFDNLCGVLNAVENGTCHLAVIEHCDLMPVPDQFDVEHLSDDSLVLVASPALRKFSGDICLEDLFFHSLYIRSKGCCSRVVFEHKIEQAGFDLSCFAKLLVCDDLNMILRSLQDGGGVGYLAKSVVSDCLRDGTLQLLDLPGFEHTFHRSLLVGPGFVGSEESHDLIRIIRSLSSPRLLLTLGFLFQIFAEPALFLF